MTDQIDTILDEVGGGEVSWTLIGEDSPQLTELPTQWRQIASTSNAHDRCQHALTLWGTDIRILLPNFFRKFQERLTDAAVFQRQDGDTCEYVLIYVAGTARDGFPALWLGWEPAEPEQQNSAFFNCFPPAMKHFLREVHSGFTAQDWESYGILRPSTWESFDGYDWFPEESFQQIEAEPSEVMWFTKDSGQLYYCISSRFPVGKIRLAYEGNFDPLSDFASELDELLSDRWELL